MPSLYAVMREDADKQSRRIKKLRNENKQLKEQIKIYEKFLDGNDLDIEWDLFCTADVCHEEEDTECKDCKYMRWTDD